MKQNKLIRHPNRPKKPQPTRKPRGSGRQRFGKKTITLRRREDHSAYGYKCTECDGHWKIYQNPYHQGSCSQK